MELQVSVDGGVNLAVPVVSEALSALWPGLQAQAVAVAAAGGLLCGHLACIQGERFAVAQTAASTALRDRGRGRSRFRAGVATCVAAGFIVNSTGATADLQWLLSVFVLFVFAVISSADALCQRVPPTWLIIGLFGIGGARALRHPLGVASYVLAALAAGSILWAVCTLWPHALGRGDAKLMVLVGLYMGEIATLFTIAVAALLALLWMWLSVARGRGRWREAIAFAPFLCVASVLVHSLESPLLHAYLSVAGAS
ncbi:MAG: hypothetical protein OWT27_02930 [Firmicutes bacterium]|nr:hypothetical protein [Bacillota bacterium]